MSPRSPASLLTVFVVLVIVTLISLIANRWPQSQMARWWHWWGRSGGRTRLSEQQRTRWDGWMAGVFGLLSIAAAIQWGIVAAGWPSALRPAQWGALGLALLAMIMGILDTLRLKS